jgi:hypothetical protein
MTVSSGVVAALSVGASKRANFVAPQLAPPSGRLERRAIQPEAALMRRRLGERFRLAGREVSVLTGTLTVNGEQQSVRIVRRQEPRGEEVTLELSGTAQPLTWKADEGARLGGAAAGEVERRLIERIVLDSPDQFVQAESRGSSYRVVGRMVRPADSGDPETYQGPLWNIVRITEPASFSDKIVSGVRLYNVNVDTGLIDRVLSKEGDDVILAELSEWTNQGGELVPMRTVWKRNGEVVMQLLLTQTSYSSRQ